jgi:excisionase family DNA binding protein
MNQAPKLDLESLLEALADRVAAKLEPRMTGAAAPISPQPRLLSVERAAAYLGRTKASVQHMISAGTLPVVRADRRVFLDVHDLDRWVEANKQPGRS